MAVVVIMPKQGQSVESCIVTEIKKKKGDTVKKGDILFTYETDKASFEEESPIDGVVLECFYKEGDEVPVLENMMVIGQPGEDYSSLLAESQHAGDDREIEKSSSFSEEVKQVEVETQSPEAESSVAEKSQTGQASVFISPRAKKLAEKEAVMFPALRVRDRKDGLLKRM